MASKYMHLIDRRPAHFNGEDICMAWRGIKLSELLVGNLATIRKQQVIAIKNDKKNRCYGRWLYDYLLVKMD